MEIITALITGFVAGLHISTWGMYKDSPHEGFEWSRYFRSALVGLVLGPVVWKLIGLDLSTASGIFLLWGSVYAGERAIIETWKTFFRNADQSKYFIPMQLHVFGKLVESKRDRYIAAVFYIGGIVLIGWILVSFWGSHKTGNLSWNPYLILLVLSVGGWISAFGGAWKDAPIEGFEWFKFFRSPAVAYFFGWLAANLTDNFLAITLCSLGFTIASIETYKTFFFPNRPRGKFQGKPILFPEILEKRKPFVYVFISCWLFIIVAGIFAFLAPHQGLV